MSVQYFTRNVYLLPSSDMFFSAPLRSRDLARALNALPAALGERRVRGGGLPGVLALHWEGGQARSAFSISPEGQGSAGAALQGGQVSRTPVSPCRGPPGKASRVGARRRQPPGAAPPTRFRGGRCETARDLPSVSARVRREKDEALPPVLRPVPAAPLPAPVAEQPRSGPARPGPDGAPAPFCPTCPAVSRGAEKEGFPRLRNAPAGSVLSAVRGASGADL